MLEIINQSSPTRFIRWLASEDISRTHISTTSLCVFEISTSTTSGNEIRIRSSDFDVRYLVYRPPFSSLICLNNPPQARFIAIYGHPHGQDDHIIKKRGTRRARSSQGAVFEALRGAGQRSVLALPKHHHAHSSPCGSSPLSYCTALLFVFHVGNSIDFADCARGKTVTVLWDCGGAYNTMRQCMKD